MVLGGTGKMSHRRCESGLSVNREDLETECEKFVKS